MCGKMVYVIEPFLLIPLKSDLQFKVKAVERLGGTSMKEECKELRSKHLDQSTVPWNITVQITTILDQWRKTDLYYVQTAAAKKVLECVQENSCVTITASSGVGKTATLQHVVLEMADEGYTVLLVTNPHDIIKFYNPNKKTLFVIDDFCGTYSIDQSNLHNWDSAIKRIKILIQNKLTKIIVACRLQIYNDEKFKSLSIFRIKVCNLLSEDFCLSQTEKQLIAETYLKGEGEGIIKYSNLFDCFPLLCKLCHDDPKLNITDFFKNPFSVYEAEMEQLKTNGFFGKYCALALCVMFNNKLEEKVLTDEIDTETRTILENTFEACRLDKGTSRLTLMDELNSLEHTLIKKDHGVYKTVHGKLFDFLSYYFGIKMTEILIKNAHSEFIMERFLFEEEDDMDKFITIVPSKYHQMYRKRMVDDWSNGKVEHVFCNKNMDNRNFRQTYLYYMNMLDSSFQMQLAHTRDMHSNATVLLLCCSIGDIPLIQWCLHHCADVNMSRFDGMYPLYASLLKGHTKIVKILLDNKADIDSGAIDEASPLFIACQKGYTDMVEILLDNKADINKCRNDGTSPLYKACEKNHVDIVKLLLDNKPDVNKAITDGSSPLFIACQKGYKDIVQLLLDKKADINRCRNDGTPPLYKACEKNHVDIVRLLLNNKPDVNKGIIDESSALFIACQKGYKDIVNMLLENKADIDKCRNGGISPLCMSCKTNHIDIAKLLVDNNADINKCTDNGMSPLFIACKENYVHIVKLLLDNNADINKCTNNGISPLCIAGQKNHLDIVQLLLDKANIQK